MRKRIRPSSFIIALLFLLLSSGTALAGSNTHAGITIDFNSTTSGDDGENTITGIGPDQNLRIDIYAHDVTALKCFELDMVIDTSKVTFLNVAFTGAITFEGNILNGATASVGQISGDTVQVAFANDTTFDGANGDGLLAEVSIRTKSDFTTSTEAYFTIISAVYQDINDSKDHILDLNTYHIDGAINPADTIPPDAVSDLLATPSATDSTITLSWTDPGGGAVTSLFKYSANPILTEAEWEDATLLANADFQGGITPTPSAGTATVIGLPEGDYYFAMKTMDSTPNVSPVSTSVVTYTVSGTVGLADNPPDSSGSVVCLDGACDTTDLHGGYAISEVSGGTYEIVATHSGYYPDTVTVTVSSDTIVNFSLNPIPPTYTVSGTIGLADNPPDSSGSVVCLDGACDTTDLHGGYAISEVSGGTYEMVATHSGYYPDTVTVTVSSDTIVNFSLNPIPPTYTVSGTIGLADNPPDSSGSVVCLDGACDTTDLHGGYAISEVSGGTYEIVATHSGYYPDTVTVTVSSDTIVDFTLAGIPAISVDTDSLKFGDVTVGSSFTQVFTISNVGHANIVVDSITYPEAYSGTVAATIPPGESIVDSVTFTPPDTFIYEGPINIYNNVELKTVYVTGRGTPVPVPKIVVNPTSLAFGDVVVGSSSQLTFAISNEGGATLEVTDINPPAAYTVSDTAFSIEPGNSEVVTVTFTPPDTGGYTGSIEILNNDVTKTIDVSGRGVVYDVGVEAISCPETVFRDQPDTVFVDVINFGNVVAEAVNVTGTLINVEADTSIGDTTLSVSLPANGTLHLGFEMPSDDTASYHVKALLCLIWAEDTNPANNCDSCSYFYNEVPIRRMGPELPQTYSLSQNYPNPFNPLTQIEYSIPRPSWVRLEVYNILGERVAILVDREQQPGNYRIGWDAGDLRSGVYFCRMEAGSFTFTRRMVLLK